MDLSIFLCCCRCGSFILEDQFSIPDHCIGVILGKGCIIVIQVVIIAYPAVVGMPVSISGSASCIVENVIFHMCHTITKVIGNYRHTFFYIKSIVVNMTIRISRNTEQSSQVILTDIVTECSTICLLTTEHDTSTGVSVAVIVLVDGSIAPVCIPGLGILISGQIILHIEAFIPLEDRILTLPGPDSCRYPVSGIGRPVIRTDVSGCSLGYISLYQRTETVHGSNGISTDVVQIVISDHYIAAAVGLCSFI